MNDHELKGHNIRTLEAYITTISPLQELEKKKANMKCQWCGKMGHNVRNCKKFKKNNDHETSFTNPTTSTSGERTELKSPPPYTEKPTKQDYDPCSLEMNEAIPRSCRRTNWKKKQGRQRMYPDLNELDEVRFRFWRVANPATLTISLKIIYIYKQEYIRKKPRLSSRNMPAIKVMENTPDQSEENILFSRKQKLVKSLPKAKISDIKSMLHLMPTVDREYYKTIGIFK